MWASLLPHARAVKIPAMAAIAQPVDIEIHPPPSPLERERTTSAITPLPSRTRTRVPINSPNMGDSIGFQFLQRCNARAGDTALVRASALRTGMGLVAGSTTAGPREYFSVQISARPRNTRHHSIYDRNYRAIDQKPNRIPSCTWRFGNAEVKASGVLGVTTSPSGNTVPDRRPCTLNEVFPVAHCPDLGHRPAV